MRGVSILSKTFSLFQSRQKLAYCKNKLLMILPITIDFIYNVIYNYLKCNFPLATHVRLLVSRLVGWLVN